MTVRAMLRAHPRYITGLSNLDIIGKMHKACQLLSSLGFVPKINRLHWDQSAALGPVIQKASRGTLIHCGRAGRAGQANVGAPVGSRKDLAGALKPALALNRIE